MFDAVIVGSGPAGVAAAYELWGRHICMVDVGKSPPDTNWGSGSNFYQLIFNNFNYTIIILNFKFNKVIKTMKKRNKKKMREKNLKIPFI